MFCVNSCSNLFRLSITKYEELGLYSSFQNSYTSLFLKLIKISSAINLSVCRLIFDKKETRPPAFFNTAVGSIPGGKAIKKNVNKCKRETGSCERVKGTGGKVREREGENLMRVIETRVPEKQVHKTMVLCNGDVRSMANVCFFSSSRTSRYRFFCQLKKHVSCKGFPFLTTRRLGFIIDMIVFPIAAERFQKAPRPSIDAHIKREICVLLETNLSN